MASICSFSSFLLSADISKSLFLLLIVCSKNDLNKFNSCPLIFFSSIDNKERDCISLERKPFFPIYSMRSFSSSSIEDILFILSVMSFLSNDKDMRLYINYILVKNYLADCAFSTKVKNTSG